MKVKTTTLQEMVSKSMQAVGNNKLIPITTLLGIECKAGKLTLVTTDGSNYLFVSQAVSDSEDFYAVVEAETISKLIQRTTSEFIEFILHDNYLTVHGNGVYNIELPLDEEGAAIKYPNPLKDKDLESIASTEIKTSTVKDILRALKPALAVTSDMPQYLGYYVGDSVIATNSEIIANLDEHISDTEILVPPEYMQILDVIGDENFKLQIDGDEIIATTPTVAVYGKLMDASIGDGDNDFKVDAIENFMSIEFKSMCKLPKQELMQILDRLELFVSPYDYNAVCLRFEGNAIKLESKKSNGVEEIAYSDSENAESYRVWIDIEKLSQSIKSQLSDTVEIWYGLDNAIKLVDGSVTKIIALMSVNDA